VYQPKLWNAGLPKYIKNKTQPKLKISALSLNLALPLLAKSTSGAISISWLKKLQPTINTTNRRIQNVVLTTER